MPGGGTLAVTTRAVQAGAQEILQVEIHDSGVGMDQAALDRIFEPYFSTKATGTGLGLTIAKRNIELLGGTVSVESARNVGTTVTLHVPTAQR
jgi:signal transduction histidine kinase